MTKAIAWVAVVAAAAATSGCGTIAGALGAGKRSPDEFRVVTQAPLTLPPDYSLRPPRPGEPRPSELEPDQEARAALFGDNVAANASQGERTLVQNAGAATVDPNIRDQIDFEAQGIVRRDQSFVDNLLSFGSSNPNTALNAEAEAQRLANDEAIRRATGGGNVVIERGGGGFKLPGT